MTRKCQNICRLVCSGNRTLKSVCCFLVLYKILLDNYFGVNVIIKIDFSDAYLEPI